MMPWRTIQGERVLGIMAGRNRPTMHVNAEVADAVRRIYVQATGETDSEAATHWSCSWTRPAGGTGSGATRSHGASVSAAVDRPDELQRAGRDNVFHETDGQVEHLQRRGWPPPSDTPERPARDRRLGGRAAGVARRRDARDVVPTLRRGARRPIRRTTELLPARVVGTGDATSHDQYPLLLHHPYFDALTASGRGQAGDLVAALWKTRRRVRSRRSAARSSTYERSPSSNRRYRPVRRGDRGRRGRTHRHSRGANCARAALHRPPTSASNTPRRRHTWLRLGRIGLAASPGSVAYATPPKGHDVPHPTKLPEPLGDQLSPQIPASAFDGPALHTARSGYLIETGEPLGDFSHWDEPSRSRKAAQVAPLPRSVPRSTQPTQRRDGNGCCAASGADPQGRAHRRKPLEGSAPTGRETRLYTADAGVCRRQTEDRAERPTPIRRVLAVAWFLNGRGSRGIRRSAHKSSSWSSGATERKRGSDRVRHMTRRAAHECPYQGQRVCRVVGSAAERGGNEDSHH